MARGIAPGPMLGHYENVTFPYNSVAGTDPTTSPITFNGSWRFNKDIRIMSISWAAQAITGAAGRLAVYWYTSLARAGSGTTIYENDDLSSELTGNITGSSLSNRTNVPATHPYLVVELAEGTGGTMVGMAVVINYIRTQHINTEPNDD